MSKTDYFSTNGVLVSIPARIEQAMWDLPAHATLVVGLSGGLDSMVLLHVSKLFADAHHRAVRAIHVNHGLSPDADEWQRHCQNACKTLGIALHTEQVTVTRNGEGIEAAARHARYAVFARQLEEDEILLLGHHQNDQAETVLMRLMRGAGPEGLAAIPYTRPVGKTALFRPFLSIPRAMLETFAREQGWQWVDDESNDDRAFDRNFIRHEVLPVLEGRWSAALDSLSQVAQRAGQAERLTAQWCAEKLPGLLSVRYAEARALDCTQLHHFDDLQQQALVRYWFDHLGVAQPAAPIFERIWSELLPAASDAQPLLQWGMHQLRRYDHCLFYTTEPATRAWQFDHEIAQPLGQLPLRIALFEGCELLVDRVPTGTPIAEGVLILREPEALSSLRVCTRQGGEGMLVAPQGSTQSLKKLFQQQGIPTWQREQIPLIYFDDVLVAAGEHLIAHGWQPQIAQPVLAFELIHQD